MNHKILVVEDVPELWEQIRNYFRENHPEYELQHASNESEAKVLLSANTFSVVVTDVDLSEGGGGAEGGFSVLAMAKQLEPDTEVIVLSAKPQADYLIRTRLGRGLSFIVRYRGPSYLDMLEEEIADALNRFESALTRRMNTPIRLLHLSDLHFAADTAVDVRLWRLVDDIQRGEHLGFERLDYLVVSGDFTNQGSIEGFRNAAKFLQGLAEEFGIPEEQCLLAPGNHDVVDSPADFETRIDQNGQKVLVRSSSYGLRFKPFSDEIYQRLLNKPYPLECASQGIATSFWKDGLQFLTLNSSWEIDQYGRNRASVNQEALTNALREAQTQEKEARNSGRLPANTSLLRIAVWHHAVDGRDQLGFVPQLLNTLHINNVCICLHGDVHELRRGRFAPWERNPPLYVAGAGSFGAPGVARPEATPRLYSLLVIQRDLRSARIHTRRQDTPYSPWGGFYEWPNPNGGHVPYYDVSFSPAAPKIIDGADIVPGLSGEKQNQSPRTGPSSRGSE